jgi:hypothetical protein
MASYNKSFNFRNGVQVDNDNFIVNANGLVGIGTSIPREFLDVYGTAKITGLVTTTDLYVTGIATFNQVRIGTGITISSSSGIITANYYYGDGSRLTNLPTSQWIDVNSGLGYTSIYAAGNVGVATTNPSYTFQVGGDPVTSNGVGFNSTGNVYISGILTARNAVITNLTSTTSTIASLQVSGTGTIATLNAPVGVVTTLSGTTLNYGGTGTLGTLNASVGVVTTLSGTTLTYGTAGITSLTATTGTITNLTSTSANITNLRTTGIATIQTLSAVDGNISYLTGENISYNGNIRSNTLNVNSGVVTAISGTNLTYSGTGSINTLNANTGIVTTISGTTLTYSNGTIATLSSIDSTITNLSSTNINASGIVTATTFKGALTGIAASATQLVTPRNFSITGSFVSAAATSFDGTGNVALAATIAPNSIGLGTHTTGNYVKSISGTENQISINGFPSAGGQPQIGLTNSVSIVNDLYAGRNIGIGTTIPAYSLDITTGNGSGVGISTLGNITATGITSTSTLKVGSEVVIQSGIITATTLKVGSEVVIQSGIITATKLVIGTAGTTITTNNNSVGIGTINPQGILDLVSTTQPFYVPRMTLAQRDAIVGVSSGAVIYNTTTNEFQGRTATAWISF